MLIWGIWGYQPTPVMMLVAALWPLGMLFALVILGRRHQRVTTLFVLAVLGPGIALFALGMVKRDLFDIRYLSTTVPVLFVLLARLLTAIPRRTLALTGHHPGFGVPRGGPDRPAIQRRQSAHLRLQRRTGLH